MKLIPNWHRKIHKLWTTRLAILGGAIEFANEALPQVQDYLPAKWYLALFALILLARLVAQPSVHD